MRAVSFVAAAALFAQAPPQNPAPLYVQSSIVSAASGQTDGLAPNMLATIYGRNLARVTRALNADDVRGGVVPTALGGTGVRVLVDRVEAPILFVSPSQVNFLVPSELTPGNAEVRLSLDGRAGPAVYVRLYDSAPSLFQWDPEFVAATRADGSPVDFANPATPGDVLILYATGLGALKPQPESGQITRIAAKLDRMAAFKVEIGGLELEREAILYAGAAPGYPGLYQINLKVPESAGDNPGIRVICSGVASPDGPRIALKR